MTDHGTHFARDFSDVWTHNKNRFPWSTLTLPRRFSLKACGPLVNDISDLVSPWADSVPCYVSKEMSMQSSSRDLGKLTDVDWLCGLNLHILHCMVWQGTARNMWRPQGRDPTFMIPIIIINDLFYRSQFPAQKKWKWWSDSKLM